MRILYVCWYWTGLSEMLYGNGQDIKGMPGFFNTFQALKKKGNDIDFIFINTPQNPIDITQKTKSLWISRENIVDVITYQPARKIKKFLHLHAFTKKLRSTVIAAVGQRKYDFIYAQGEYSYGAVLAANQLGIPCGQRFYGTFLWDFYQKHGYFRTLLFGPTEIRSYRTAKAFQLTTNDGTNGDKAQKLFGKPNLYPFYFWINGVNKVTIEPDLVEQKKSELSHPAIVYVGRIALWKRQDKAIRVLAHLKEKGVTAHLYIAGQVNPCDQPYYESLVGLAQKLGVTDQITYCGALTREEIALMNKACDISLLMYDVSNMGNVFHEMLSDGSALVALNDGSLDQFCKHNINCMLIEDEEDASQAIMKILNQPAFQQQLREQAMISSQQKMRTWQERVEDEIQLIENAGISYEKYDKK